MQLSSISDTRASPALTLPASAGIIRSVPSTSTEVGRLKRALPFAVAWLFTIVLVVPWRPANYESSPDLSWQLALHDAHAEHLRFGDEVIFTFGPWGFTSIGYDPRTFAEAIAAWLLVAIGIAAAAHEIARLTLGNPWRCAAFMVLVALLTCVDPVHLGDITAMSLAFLFVRAHFLDARRSLLSISAVALGFVSLSKFSFLVAAVLATVACAIDDAVRKRLPVTTGVYAAAVAAFWLLARQPLSLFPRFLSTSFDIAQSYSIAMSLQYGWLDDQVVLIAFAVLASAFVIAIAATGWDRSRVRALIFAWGASAILFVAFKAGFVRYDAHDVIPIVTLLVMVIASAAQPRFPKVWLSLILGALLLAAHEMPQRRLSAPGKAMAIGAAHQIRALTTLLVYGTDDQERARQSRLNTLHAQLDSRPDGRSFDLYPTDTGLLSAWRLPLARRPVFQSFACYTPRLLELNAAHLRSASAPETVLFTAVPRDGFYVSTQDGLSWPELFTRYDLGPLNGQYLELHRRAQPRGWHLEPAGESFGQIGEIIRLPADAPLWATMTVETNIFGRLATLLWKLPPIWSTIATDTGKTERVRIVPGTASAGFLISPLVKTRSDFAAMYSAESQLPRIAWLRVERGPSSWLLRPRITVRYSRLRIDRAGSR